MSSTATSAINAILEPGQVTELRAFMPPDARGFSDKWSGYFDDPKQLISTARTLDRQGAAGIYFIPNPINPSLLARSQNRARVIRREPCTKNEEVIRRKWLLLDFDPVRPAGVSSTDEEKAAAHTRMREVARHLKEVGFSEPVAADSGNGFHLLYPIDLEPEDDLCERVTRAVALRFSDDAVTVDQAVHNAARIWKLYGTTTRKGDDTPDRPHRKSAILHVPEETVPTARELLEQVASEYVEPANVGLPTNGVDGPPIHEEIPHVLSFLPDRLDYDGADHKYPWPRAIAGVLDKCGGDIHAAEAYLKARWPEERPGEYAEKLANPLRRVTWGSVVNMAKERGYDPSAYYKQWYRTNRPTNGTSASKDAKVESADDENHGSQAPGDFWYFEETKGGGEAVKIDQSGLIDWFEGQGVCKVFEYDSDTPAKVRRRGLVIEHFPDARLRVLADKHLRQQSDKRPLEALRRGWNVYLSSTKLDAVKTIEPIFQRSTKEAAYVYYKNGFVTVTAEDILLQSYDDLRGFIWRDWIIGREIDLEVGSENWLDCEFGRFMQLVTDQDEARLRSLISAVGYLLHPFKDPAVARAVVITDQKISDDPEGGTGKGIVAQALSKIVPTVDIDSKRLDLRSQFAFQSVQPGVTRIIHFDDPGNRFSFNDLFPAITGSFAVEKKGRDQIVIPFEDSPKFIITTNEVLRGRGGSHERRIFELEFSDYFDVDRTPEDEFGHLLFHDWDREEWNRFDRLMLYCVQYYLEHGLQTYQHVNLAWKKFVRGTSREFGDFVETMEFETGKRYSKPALINTFEAAARKISSNQLTRWLNVYAGYRGWKMVNRLGNDRDEFEFRIKE